MSFNNTIKELPQIDVNTFSSEFLKNRDKLDYSIEIAKDIIKYNGVCLNSCFFCPFSKNNLSEDFTHNMFTSRYKGEDAYLARCAEKYLQFIEIYLNE